MALALGLRPSFQPHAALHTFGSTWGNPQLHCYQFVCLQCLPPAAGRAVWDPCPCAIHLLGRSLPPALNKVSRREHSLPVWLGQLHLDLTSDTKPVRQPKPPGVGLEVGEGAGGQKEQSALLDPANTNRPAGHEAPASAAGITHPDDTGRI